MRQLDMAEKGRSGMYVLEWAKDHDLSKKQSAGRIAVQDAVRTIVKRQTLLAQVCCGCTAQIS